MASTTILVIDDEPQIRRAVRSALSEPDVRVTEAATGKAGIDLAAAERPTLAGTWSHTLSRVSDGGGRFSMTRQKQR